MLKPAFNLAFEKYLAGSADAEDLKTILDYFQDANQEEASNYLAEKLRDDSPYEPSNTEELIVKRVFFNLLKARFLELEAKARASELTEKEQEEWKGYQLHSEQLRAALETPESTSKRRKSATLGTFPSLNPKDGQPGSRRLFQRKNWPYLIALLFLTCLSICVWQLARHETVTALVQAENEINLPIENDASLLLADGRLISIRKASKAFLLSKGIELVRSANQEIIFKIGTSPIQSNEKLTFISPKGMLSHLILADNSHVYLNSSSSITYPSSFTEKERTVSLDGEAYFHVTQNLNRPFIVRANETQIKVLGTSFNVATNLIKGRVLTTLQHGSVEVITKNKQVRISPGMQTVSHNVDGEIDTSHVDIAKEVAWKSGMFKFSDEDIYGVMEKLKAWYDIEDIEIHGLTSDRFSGTVKRTRQLSELLQNLEKISNYTFHIKDRRIIIEKAP